METNLVFCHFRGHKNYITCVAVTEAYVFTGSADNTIKKWDLVANKCMFTYTGHNSKIHKILVTKDLLFSTSNDKTGRVWHNKITKLNMNKPLIRTFRVRYSTLQIFERRLSLPLFRLTESALSKCPWKRYD